MKKARPLAAPRLPKRQSLPKRHRLLLFYGFCTRFSDRRGGLFRFRDGDGIGVCIAVKYAELPAVGNAVVGDFFYPSVCRTAPLSIRFGIFTRRNEIAVFHAPFLQGLAFSAYINFRRHHNAPHDIFIVPPPSSLRLAENRHRPWTLRVPRIFPKAPFLRAALTPRPNSPAHENKKIQPLGICASRPPSLRTRR